MAGLLAAAQPYFVGAVGMLVPSLTLLYARRDKKKDETRTTGQQFVDNLFKDNQTLRDEIQVAKRAQAEAEERLASRDRAWTEIGTTYTEALAASRFAYDKRRKHEPPGDPPRNTPGDPPQIP